MTDSTTDMRSRLAGLSPEKQALLARMLADRAATRGPADVIAPRGETGPGVLSHAQELLWLYEQMVPGTAAYNIPMARRVLGALDVARLQAAFDALVERHASLRTRFAEVEGAPRQLVEAPKSIAIDVRDLREASATSREAEAARILRARAAEPFDLTAGTWPRVLLVRLSEQEWLLLIVVHHAVFDGASVGILFRELAALYSGDAVETLKPLPIQLIDYAEWERRTLDDAHLAKDIAYWREYLVDAPAGIELPTDFARQPGLTGPGARVVVTLPPEASVAARLLAERTQSTPFIVVFAAFHALMHRYSGQDDIVLGTPVANRTRAGTEGLVGYLANTLAFRSRFADDPSFMALARRMRDDAGKAFEHHDAPYERLVRELRGGRPSAEQALFKVMFTFQDSTDITLRLGDAVLEPVAIDVGAAKFDLSMSVTDMPAGLRTAVEYRSDLFAPETIARLIDHLHRFLLAAADAPQTRVSQIHFLSPREHEQLLGTWNDTEAGWPKDVTLDQLFEKQALQRPDAIAVECGDVSLTYAELNRRANRLAWRLRARGVVPDTLVAVCMERSVDTVAVLLGILKAGGAYVPIDPAYPDDRIAYTLEDSGAALVITDDEQQQRIAALGAEALSAAGMWSDAADEGDVAPTPIAGPGNLCYVIYTSGSTGRPKGVLIEHRNVVRLLFNDRFQFVFNERDVWTLFHSFAFDFSVWEMYGALLYGGRLVVVPREIAQQPAEFLALLESRGVTVLNQVPSAFYALAQEDRARSAARLALRYIIFGGEALQPALLAEWHARYPLTTLVNMFGITETTVHVTFKEIGNSEIENGASNIGGPIPTLTLYVLDQHLQLVPLGATGELCVGGAGVARGYLNRPALSAERFVEHPFKSGERLYRSGDLGRIRANGDVEYLGRRDAQVKIRGFRIELGEIETVLAQHPLISACAAAVRIDGPQGARLVAYFVAAPGTAKPSRGDLRSWAAEHLPEYMVPAAFVEVTALPLTSNGKVNRAALPAPTDVAELGVDAVAPRDDLETVIADIWSKVLGVARLGVETSFFDLGGHSLLATRITAQVSKIFRTTLPLRRFFEAPTVGMAVVMRELEPKAGQALTIARLYLKAIEMNRQKLSTAEQGELKQNGGGVAQPKTENQ